MRANAGLISITTLAIAAALLSAACADDPSDWYPSGKASVVSYYESSDGSIKSCVATCKLENTGNSTISTYTISISATTDVRTYYRTATADLTILPDKSAYTTVEIGYATTTEVLAAYGLAVVDEYYQ